jgi:tRNA(Arg) A34 adenosine deaminase TadA
MQKAIELSIRNVREGKGGPFGAVVVKDGHVIAEGVNRVTIDNDPSAHAEIVAIREACRSLGHFQLNDCEMYTSCEPCPMCLAAIYWARLAKVYYGNSSEAAAAAGFTDEDLYHQLSLAPGERRIPMMQLMPEEANHAFKEWQWSPKKVEY